MSRCKNTETDPLHFKRFQCSQDAVRDGYCAKHQGSFHHVQAMTRRITELEAERDDYKSRWEETGCTRHGAMETAIALNKKTQAKLDAVKNLPQYTRLGVLHEESPTMSFEWVKVVDVLAAIGEQE